MQSIFSKRKRLFEKPDDLTYPFPSLLITLDLSQNVKRIPGILNEIFNQQCDQIKIAKCL